MAEGNWQCGMCAAYNEPSKHACMVCDTFQELGARGTEPSGGDLLAPVQSMFEASPREPVAARPSETVDDLPPVRVMEPPPVRPGRERVSEPIPEPAPAAAGSGAQDRFSENAPEPVTERRERWAWADTEPVPVPVATVSEAGVTEPLPTVPAGSGTTHGRSGRWSLPRWPQGTVRALALAAVGSVVLVLVWVLPGTEDEAVGPAEGEERGRECPERIAAHVPGSAPGPLVDAFETERHRIVLCANDAGELYYFGEFLDGGGEVMVVPAERTDEGYVADAGQTRYEIGGGVVVITGGDGAEIARLPLESVSDPE